jgi:hypothetical protein
MKKHYLKYWCTCEDCGYIWSTWELPWEFLDENFDPECWPNRQSLPHPDCDSEVTIEPFWTNDPPIPREQTEAWVQSSIKVWEQRTGQKSVVVW